jgi:uncharacterized membrane protein YdbT with pleckstrin-like domain
MAELEIRPSRRRMVLSVVLALALAALVVVVYLKNRESLAWWVLLVGLIPFAGAVAGWLDTKRMVLTVGGGSVRGEFGLWRKQRREIALARVAAVTVERSFAQRLYGVGTVTVEGTGPGERIVTAEVDRPKRVARQIEDAAKVAGAAAAMRERVAMDVEEEKDGNE